MCTVRAFFARSNRSRAVDSRCRARDRCNAPFTHAIAIKKDTRMAKEDAEEGPEPVGPRLPSPSRSRRLHRRGHPRSPRREYRYAAHTFSLEAVIPPRVPVAPRFLLASLAGSPPIFSLAAGTRVAYFRAYRASRRVALSRPYRSRTDAHKSQCARECRGTFRRFL